MVTQYVGSRADVDVGPRLPSRRGSTSHPADHTFVYLFPSHLPHLPSLITGQELCNLLEREARKENMGVEGASYGWNNAKPKLSCQ